MTAPRRFLAVLALTLACAPATALAAPTFSNNPGPDNQAGDAGEPSIGYNPHTGKVFFQSGTTTSRVDFSQSPPRWDDVTEPTATVTADPILFTDRGTGRTFASQLLLACSKMSYTDDDGANWTPSQGCGVGTLLDHQSVGGGPYAQGGIGALGAYPHAVYYCAQAQLAAQCALSRDGGQTFGPGMPIYTASQCGQGLHGHLKVGPDGTAYVPVFDCGGKQALSVSRDNGSSWQVEQVPGSTTQDESDPHLGIGAKGTLYFGYQGADGADLGDRGYVGHARSEGHALISVKPSGSSSWSAPVDVGAQLGVKNIQFPEVYALDDDRAAYAFLGTTTAGDDQAADFKGAWHLYVAFTYDRGASWTTVDATPSDPVQRGCIWLQGDGSDCRNLLDFNDITADSQGRVLVAYADGCTGRCAGDTNDFTDKDKHGTIARQLSGFTLAAAADPPGATPPAGAARPCRARGVRLVRLPRRFERLHRVRATVRGKRVRIRALAGRGRRPSVRVRFRGHRVVTLRVTARAAHGKRVKYVRRIRACR